jgi:uncharacterized phage protein gp47/JayE
MSLAVPSVQQIADNMVAQIESSIEQTIPIMPKAFVRVLAKVWAGVFILIYKYAGWMFLQWFVAYATMQETTINGKVVRPLVLWGRLVGVGDPLAATRSQLSISATVTNQTGELPASTLLVCSDNGFTYQLVAPVALNAPTVTASVIAVSDQDDGGGVGAAGNLPPGASLAFANAPANVTSTATVTAQTVTGADAEAPEAYRARIIKRFQRKPQGGAYADYQIWGEGVAGIANVYPYAGAPGEVDVYVEATVESSGDPDGLPTPAQKAAVYQAIQSDDGGVPNRRPVNAAVNVLSITRTPVAVQIFGLTTPDESATKDSIADAVDEFLRTREPFIEGLSSLPRQDRITVASLGGLVETVVSAEGGTVIRVVMKIAGVELNSYTLGTGEKAKSDGDPTYL